MKQNIISAVQRDAAINSLCFIVGTIGVILAGCASRRLGVVLAGIEAFFVVLQSLKVIFIIAVDVMLWLSVRSGKRRREEDETEMQWATLIRTVELGIWTGCLVVLYRFFF